MAASEKVDLEMRRISMIGWKSELEDWNERWLPT